MPYRDPLQRKQNATAAAHTSWAKTKDWTARTAPATKASMSRFDREVDPEGVLPPHERAKRAEAAKKAYFIRLGMKSGAARRRKKNAADSDRKDAA